MYKLYMMDIKDIKDITLPRDVLNHVNRYKIDERRKESMAGYYILIEGLKDFGIYNPKIDFSFKPKLIGSNIDFSISHDNGIAACAISNENIGIDIMKIRQINIKMLERILNQNEAMPKNDLEYTRLWCMKEAAIKYIASSIPHIKEIDTTSYLYDIKENNGYIICICYGKI